jgi:hypothetical protein
MAVEPSRREGTHQEHRRRIREYLGLKTFDLATQEQIEWVCGQTAEGLSAAEIFPHAEETLRPLGRGPAGTLDFGMSGRLSSHPAPGRRFSSASACALPRSAVRTWTACWRSARIIPAPPCCGSRNIRPKPLRPQFLSYLEQYALLRSLQIERIGVSGFSPEPEYY